MFLVLDWVCICYKRLHCINEVQVLQRAYKQRIEIQKHSENQEVLVTVIQPTTLMLKGCLMNEEECIISYQGWHWYFVVVWELLTLLRISNSQNLKEEAQLIYLEFKSNRPYPVTTTIKSNMFQPSLRYDFGLITNP